MRELAQAKARELEALCMASHIPPPTLGPLLAELDRPGQVMNKQQLFFKGDE
jgi:protein regulator of cytokinesis 1